MTPEITEGLIGASAEKVQITVFQMLRNYPQSMYSLLLILLQMLTSHI